MSGCSQYFKKDFGITYLHEMMFSTKIIYILDGIFLIVLLSHSIWRDVHLEKQYTVDLRNRVVGARLEKDRKFPYNYYFESGENPRYFDIQNLNKDSLGTSNVTASPFFHQLLFPICDLPQSVISKIWLWFQYFLLLGLIIIMSTLTYDKNEKLLIANFGVIFTFTEAWKNLIACGQLYFFVAFLICCVIAFLSCNKKSGIILAGICATAFVLVRPFGIVLFIPFLFFYRKYLLFLTVSFSALIIYVLFILNDPYEKSLYLNYASMMKMHVQHHQNVPAIPPVIHNTNAEYAKNLEGISFEEANRQINEYPIKVYSENGNFFLLYNHLTHNKITLVWLFILSSGIILFLTVLFYFQYNIYPPQKIKIFLLGFTSYMIVEIFGPISRHQYNTVQWFPLILAGILALPEWNNRIYFLIIAGLVLNIVNLPWLPMRHTLGEFCWLTGLILLVFSQRLKQVA